jgi:hypothetical protein
MRPRFTHYDKTPPIPNARTHAGSRSVFMNAIQKNHFAQQYHDEATD